MHYTCVSVVSGCWLECSRTMDSDSPGSHTIINHHIEGMTVLCSCKHGVLGLIIVWTLIDRLEHVYRDIVYTGYLFDVLVESHTAQLLLDYYCTMIAMSVLRGGGGCFWGPETQKKGGGWGTTNIKTKFTSEIFVRKMFLGSWNAGSEN